jgi:hypothetical protein
MDPMDTRSRLADLFDAAPGSPAEQARNAAFATFVRDGDGDRVPCWGGIFERFAADFPEASDRAAALDLLLQAGDRRPLYLLVHLAEEQPALFDALAERAGELPEQIQRALVSLERAPGALVGHEEKLCAAAREVLANEAERAKERQQLEGRVAELRAWRWFG